jgi:hypothetical protein
MGGSRARPQNPKTEPGKYITSLNPVNGSPNRPDTFQQKPTESVIWLRPACIDKGSALRLRFLAHFFVPFARY